MGAKLNLCTHQLVKSSDESERAQQKQQPQIKDWKQFVWIVCNLNIIFFSRLYVFAKARARAFKRAY